MTKYTNSKNLKIVFSLLLSFLIVIAITPVSFADTEVMAIPYLYYDQGSGSVLTVGQKYNKDVTLQLTSDPGVNVYCFLLLYSGSADDGTPSHYRLCCLADNTVTWPFTVKLSSWNSDGTANIRTNSISETGGSTDAAAYNLKLFMGVVSSSYVGTWDDSLPVFATVADASAAVRDQIDNPPGAVYSKFTMQNGWLAAIDLGAANTYYNLELTTSFAEYSHLSQPYWNSSQAYWFGSSLPEPGSSFDNSSLGTIIPWDKTGDDDLLGRTKNAIANLSGYSTDRYLFIYNPVFHNYDSFFPSLDAEEINLPVVVSGIRNGYAVTVYKMDENLHLSDGLEYMNSGITSTYTGVSGTTTADDSPKDLTSSFVDGSGNTVVQNSGGANALNEQTGVLGIIGQINNTLNNFTNSFVQLVSAPISHINVMISAGSNFFSLLADCFTWIPAPERSLLFSAFTISIVVGVIKLLF